MANTVSDFLVQRLLEWGVERIYGYPGDGINGLLGALEKARDRLDFVQVRHEEMAAFMACAHAKFTGQIGVCCATSGPGAVHLLNGLYDAKLDHQPVLAIVGQAARQSLGGDYQQELDLVSLFKDVAHEYVQMATVPGQVRHLVDRAIRIALVERSVTCIILPSDLQECKAVPAQPHRHATIHSGIGCPSPRVIPARADLRRAASILNSGRRVAMLVGAGCLRATDEVIETAEVLGAGVAKALLGKAAVPDDLPFVTGSIGLLGTKPSWEMMAYCDTLLMVGSSFPYPEFLPREGAARGIQIDIDGRLLSIRYPMELSLIGDSAETLRALLPLLRRKTNRAWRRRIEAGVRQWRKILEARALDAADPINPQLLFWELSPRLPDHCIVTADSGTVANWYARDLVFRRGMMGSLSGGLATMGPGVPYAIAAKFAFPERTAIVCVGDGAMQMNGINELITISRYWKEWFNPKLIVLVLNNRDLNMVTWEQRALSGFPKFADSQELPDFPYADFAELLGLKGIRLEEPAHVGDAWDEALAANRPVVIDAHTDPEVPTLPPHISLEQARNYARSIMKGDAHARDFIQQSFRQMLDTWFPRRRARQHRQQQRAARSAVRPMMRRQLAPAAPVKRLPAPRALPKRSRIVIK